MGRGLLSRVPYLSFVSFYERHTSIISVISHLVKRSKVVNKLNAKDPGTILSRPKNQGFRGGRFAGERFNKTPNIKN